jgi:hypothetical protein
MTEFLWKILLCKLLNYSNIQCQYFFSVLIWQIFSQIVLKNLLCLEFYLIRTWKLILKVMIFYFKSLFINFIRYLRVCDVLFLNFRFWFMFYMIELIFNKCLLFILWWKSWLDWFGILKILSYQWLIWIFTFEVCHVSC